MIFAVFQHAKARINALWLKVDRVSRLGVRFHGHDIGLIGRRKNDEFTESTVERDAKLAILVEIDKPRNATLSGKHEAGQDII